MSIKDRAREFFNERGFRYTPEIATQDFVDFAALERENAVREFIEKVKNGCEHGNWQFLMNDVFREMFNKELDGSGRGRDYERISATKI